MARKNFQFIYNYKIYFRKHMTSFTVLKMEDNLSIGFWGSRGSKGWWEGKSLCTKNQAAASLPQAILYSKL